MEELNDLHLFAQAVEAGGFSAAERSTVIPSCAVASACSSNVALGDKRLDAQLFVPGGHVLWTARRSPGSRDFLTRCPETEGFAAGPILADGFEIAFQHLRPAPQTVTPVLVEP